jgi:hypothetical protein
MSFSSYSQDQKYYIKINDEHFNIDKDSCGNIFRIKLIVKKATSSFSIEYTLLPDYSFAPNIKYYIEKDEIKNFIAYDWFQSDNVSIFGSNSLIKSNEVVFIRDYNSKYYEAFTTSMVYSVE